MALEDLATGKDLFEYTLKFAQQSTASTDDYAQDAKAAIRQAYWDILQLEPFWFSMAQNPGVLSIVGSQNVNVSSISGKIWTLSAPLATSMAGRKVYLDSTQVTYRILTHTANTAVLNVDADYAEGSPSSGAGVIVQDEYSLGANVLKPWGPMPVRSQFRRTLELFALREFQAKFGYLPLLTPGFTEAGCIIRRDSNGYPVMQITPPSTDLFTIQFEYTEFHNLDFNGGASDTPRLPLPDRWVIGERALFTLWRNKNDTLADSAGLRSERKLNEMRSFHLGMPTREGVWVRRGNSLGVSG